MAWVLHSSKIIGWVMLTGMAISVQVDVPETAAATPAPKRAAVTIGVFADDQDRRMARKRGRLDGQVVV
jgi:hypothetical protein